MCGHHWDPCNSVHSKVILPYGGHYNYMSELGTWSWPSQQLDEVQVILPVLQMRTLRPRETWWMNVFKGTQLLATDLGIGVSVHLFYYSRVPEGLCNMLEPHTQCWKCPLSSEALSISRAYLSHLVSCGHSREDSNVMGLSNKMMYYTTLLEAHSRMWFQDWLIWGSVS